MNKEEFIKYLKEINIEITEDELKKFETYKNLLQEYNEKFNLTAIKTDGEIYLKHFFDSLYLITLNEIKQANTILDVGTGAGFPGIPLGILLNDKKITLVEANEKKCSFLEKVKEILNLDNIIIVNSRAEEYVKNNKEKYDIVTSRAVANLLVLSELEIPALKIGGYFLPLKSNVSEELKICKDKIEKLGAKIENLIEYELPKENSKRTIIKIIKNRKTEEIYPRDYSKIIKDLKKLTK